MAIDLNPTILGRPLFPSAETFKEWGSALVNAFTPAATSIPAAGPFTPTAAIPQPTVDGTKIPLPFSQLRYTGPLLGTGPMFAVKGTPAPTPQPEPVKTDIGAYAATRFPFSFDVAKTQTPSMQQPNIAALTGGAQPLTFTAPTQIPFTSTKPTVPMYDSAVKYGTVTGTPAQIERINAGYKKGEGGKLERVYNSPDRTPAQQETLLAQMRQRGAEIMRGNIASQKQFFAQKAQERAGLRLAEAEAKSRGFSPIEIMKAREASQPSNFAGIVRQASEYSQRLPMEGVATSAISKFSRALPSGGPYSTVYGGAPINRLVPDNPYSNTRAEQRRETRRIARSMGLQPAYSHPIQAAQERLFRERGLM